MATRESVGVHEVIDDSNNHSDHSVIDFEECSIYNSRKALLYNQWDREYHDFIDISDVINCSTCSRNLKIFIIGRVGSGKSTLLNELIHRDVAEVNCGLLSVTEEIKSYNAYGVTFIDTSGFGSDDYDLTKLHEVISMSNNNSQFLYTFNISTRITKSELRILKQVPVNTILILTKIEHYNPDTLKSLVDNMRKILRDINRSDVTVLLKYRKMKLHDLLHQNIIKQNESNGIGSVISKLIGLKFSEGKTE